MKKFKNKIVLMFSAFLLVFMVSISSKAEAATYSFTNWSSFPVLGSGYTTSGNFVGFAQSLLYSAALSGTVGTIDKSYGSKTQAAVKSYQTKKGLTSDGYFGPSTWKSFQNNSYRTSTSSYTHQDGSSTYETVLYYYAVGDGSVNYNYNLYYMGSTVSSYGNLWSER